MNKLKRHCPECMSTTVDYSKIEFDDERCISITAYGYCHKCKTHFKDHYGVVFKTCEKYDYDPWDGPMSAPVSNSSSKKPKVTLKRVPHKHVYEYYRTCSSGMSPDAGMVWEEWRCNRNGCGDIIRRNERILEQEAWWNR